MLAARRSAPLEARARADAALCQELDHLVRRQRPKTVAAYVPLLDEPGWGCLLESLSGSRVLLPVLLDDLDLDWAEYAGPTSLVPIGRGLRAPEGSRLGTAAIATASLVIVPAVAVDHAGVRLGRGGGSYDRTLTRLGESALVVALLYDGELVERLPAEPHDSRVHAVIMPTFGLVNLPTDAGRTAGA